MATSPVALASGTGLFHESTVQASGSFSGEVPVPTGIELGDQTLQIDGYDPDGAVFVGHASQERLVIPWLTRGDWRPHHPMVTIVMWSSAGP